MNSSSSFSDIINVDSSSDEESEPAVKYHTVTGPDGKIRKIPDYYMAYGHPPDPQVRLPMSTRIIARRKQQHFPMGYHEGKLKFLHHNDDSAFYAGILSCECMLRNGNFNYLVFFDDGHVQYVPSHNIRVVFGNYGKKYVHENAQKFYDYYFCRVKQKQMMEISCKVDNTLCVFLDNRFEPAKVVEYDKEKRRGLVLVHFLKSQHAEWLYIGSPRIEKLWKSIQKDKEMLQYHQTNETLIEVSSDSEDDETDIQSPQKKPLPADAKDPKQKTMMLKPQHLIDGYKSTQKLDRTHECNEDCVREFEKNPQVSCFFLI